MKIVQYEYIVKARVQLTAAEVYHLIDLSLSHYDHKCRSAARPGEGAFLNAFKNTICADGTATRFLSVQELDLLGKILEGPEADIGLKEAVRECWRALRDEAMGTDCIMRAVWDQAPFQEPEADDDNRFESVYLTLEQVVLVRHLARLAGDGVTLNHDQCVAMGAMSPYLDECNRTSGTDRHLNARELTALRNVVQGSLFTRCQPQDVQTQGSALQTIFQEALDRLQAQVKRP